MESTAQETRTPVQLGAIALPTAAVLCLMAFGSAAWWSWQHSPLSNPLEAPGTGSFWKWFTSPIERNAVQRLQRVRGTLNAAFALRATRDIWVVGDGGLILHSADGGAAWELQSKITWQSPAAAPQTSQTPSNPAAETARKNSPHFDFGLIATANAADAPPRSSPREVTIMQRALAKLGYYNGPVDGIQSIAFQNAIREYQRSAGMKEDGALTDELNKRLLSDAATDRNRATLAPGQTRAPSVTASPAQTGTPSTGPATAQTNAPSTSPTQVQTNSPSTVAAQTPAQSSPSTQPAASDQTRASTTAGALNKAPIAKRTRPTGLSVSNAAAASSGSPSASAPGASASAVARPASVTRNTNQAPASVAPSPPLPAVTVPVDLRSIAFADGVHGIAVGQFGVVLTTQDGGTTWIAAARQMYADLNEVRFIDNTRAVVVADDGAIFTSDDRGTTWRGNERGSGALLSVDFANTRLGLAAGVDGRVLGTRDGGVTWQLLLRSRAGVREELSAVRYADAQHAAALRSSDNSVMVTSDGGQTWATVGTGAPAPLRFLAFADDRRGIAVGNDGAVVRTKDAGKTWTRTPSVTSVALRFIAFADSQRAVAVGGGGTILTSNDGGQSWVAKTLAESDELLSVRFADKRNGIAVGREGVVTVTSDGGASWNAMPSGATQALYEVGFVSGERWVAVGAKGAVIVTTDGGRTWSPRKTAASADLYSVRFTAANRGIAVGDHGTALLTVDGGDTWTPVTLPTSGNNNVGLRSVRFFDAQQAIVSAPGLSPFLSRDGGATWQRSQSIGPLSLATANNGLVIGPSAIGGISLSRDGGEHWRFIRSPTSATPNAVDLAGATRGLAVGNHGEILLSTDGGEHWDAKQSGDTADLRSVSFADARNAIAVGAGRTILTSSDGGESWQPVAYARYPAPWVYAFLFVAVGGAAAHKRTAQKQQPERLTIADIIVSDRPIQQGDPDFFGFTRRALQLSRFLRHERTDLPVTLAITAEWGRGKSSLMNLVSADLEQNGFRPVWFNAWHHEKEGNLLASLLRAVRQQALPHWWNPRGLLIRVQLLQKRGWGYLVAAAIPVILVLALIAYFGNYPDRWQAVGPNLKYILNIERPTIVTERTVARLEAKYGKPETTVPEPWLGVLRQFQKTEHRFNNPDELLAALRAQDVARTDPLSTELADAIAGAAEHIPPVRRVFPELGNVWTGFSAALAAFIAAVTVVLNGMSTFGLRAPKAKAEDDTETTGTRERYAADFKRLTEAMGKYLVVLIDDLDRCSRKSLLDMFEHINFLASEGSCSIIVAIAYERVLDRLAITLAQEAGRKRENGPEGNDLKEADFYLHKLIQLKLAIPEPAANESLQLFTSNTKVTTPPENAFVRTARTVGRHALPWGIIGVLSLLGIWMGGHWIDAVYPRSTLQVFSQQLATLDQANSSGLSAPAAATGTPTTVSNETPKPSAVPAELLPGVSGTFPTRWAMTLVILALLAVTSLIILRDPPLQRRLLTYIHTRWRGVFAPPLRERDSEAFVAALTIWYPLAAVSSPSPRDLKRFLNRLRFEVMSIISGFPISQNREPQIVALAALHEYNPVLSAENLHAIFARARQPSDSWAAKGPDDGLDLLNSRLLVFKAAEAHIKRFDRGPDSNESAAYAAFVGTRGTPGSEPL